jgi:squalene-associated FAD-dependent desaturase
MKKHFDVVIIGGGLSGLAAALKLISKNLRIAIFEQSSRLGGRCYSYLDEPTGDIVDNGQHILLGAYHRTLEYLEIAGTKKFLRREPSFALPLFHPTKGFATFRVASLPKPFHLTAGMLQFKLLSMNDRRRLLRVGLQLQGWNGILEKRLGELTVDDWLKSLHQSDEALRCFWYPIAISVMNEMPEKASAVLFARSLRAAFLSKKTDSAILIPTIGQSELYVTNVVSFLEAAGASINLGSEVTSLHLSKDRVTGVLLDSGEEISAGNVLSAVPYYALLRILPARWKGVVPFSDFHAFNASPIISIHLWFEREVMEIDYVGVIGSQLQWIFNRRRILGNTGRSGGYITCVISGAHSLVHRSKDELVRMALDEIRKIFPASSMVALRRSVVIKEKRATFSPTNDVERLRPNAVTPIENFYLAGDWTNTGLPATIEGAIMSGFAAAETILRG